MKALARPIHEASVLVIGGGAIGMLSALLLRHVGAASVTVAELNPLRREAVTTHAGAHTLDPRVAPPPEGSFDVVIDAVGARQTRTSAIAGMLRASSAITW